jgi:hypothetical protein
VIVGCARQSAILVESASAHNAAPCWDQSHDVSKHYVYSIAFDMHDEAYHLVEHTDGLRWRVAGTSQGVARVSF